MKVKQFVHDGSDFSSACDERINNFIQDKEVIDVKLSAGKYERVVLVMYEDKGGMEDEK